MIMIHKSNGWKAQCMSWQHIVKAEFVVVLAPNAQQGKIFCWVTCMRDCSAYFVNIFQTYHS